MSLKELPLSLLVAIVFFSYSCKRDRPRTLDDLYLPNLNLLFARYDLLDSTKTYGAFAKKLERANTDLQSSQMFVEAAYLYHQAGEHEQVARVLHRAIDRGMSNPKILDKFPGLQIQPASEPWKSLQFRLDSIDLKLQEVTNFSLEMQAMQDFWIYFEKAKEDSTRAKQHFKQFIFEGPQELRDYYVARYTSVENMYGQMINAAPKYYSYLKDQFSPDSLEAMKSKTTNWMKRFKEIYPQAVFPKVYVVPGILNSGGTATEMGMFVGGDMYGRSEFMPTEELTEWQLGAIMEFSSLPGLTIHELMHFQQSYKDTLNANNVLFKLVEEGVCDFLVELSSEEVLQNDNLNYLKIPQNKQKILADLKQDMFTEDLSRWMYNGGSIKDRPYDLGYTLGYLITKSYYNNHPNKNKAVYELLNSADVTEILKGSDYAHVLE